jgi:hypothetical protein
VRTESLNCWVYLGAVLAFAVPPSEIGKCAHASGEVAELPGGESVHAGSVAQSGPRPASPARRDWPNAHSDHHCRRGLPDPPRPPGQEHPRAVHAALGTQSEQELQQYVDDCHVADFYGDDGEHPGAR